ncbi:hypothetical protein K3725_09750 [Leisingera sp. S132]|uniref:hypothetical protein n=1 Tax=Leisingera sp. S132 TaxID=2867016 RepID=UPI0021A6D3CC|nr:hypothetical protein [Leisingera sp. S132]UWQ77606.1 hypothetical protein K3725_09750 [Leisingera sp. S132]
MLRLVSQIQVCIQKIRLKSGQILHDLMGVLAQGEGDPADSLRPPVALQAFFRGCFAS